MCTLFWKKTKNSRWLTKYIFRSSFFLVGLLFTSFLFAASAQEKTWVPLHSPQSPWVKVQKPDYSLQEPKDLIEDGLYYLLYDHQILVNAERHVAYYHRFVEKATDTNGLESVSSIKINFDPQYQQVNIHSVNIIRDGKLLDVYSKIKISVLNREQELEDSIYNGLLTFHLIIPDLRLGDVVDYSYTIQGENPIYGGHFSTSEFLDWSVPVARQHFLIDWMPQDQPLFYKKDNTDLEPNITEMPGHTLYELQLESQPLKKYNSQAPSWHNIYQRIYFSDLNQWQSVVNWALPLYKQAIEVTPDVTAIAKKINSESKNDSEKITNALHYVQSQIRYLGIEIGVNSHQPSHASDTLLRRYGDCKDKVVLLISVFKALGIEAVPALVNTDVQQELENRLASVNVFNHVIVRVNLAGNYFWLDPTRSFQRGSLTQLSQSDYGFALVIQPDETQLQAMKGPKYYKVVIKEAMDVSQGVKHTADYSVDTHYLGSEAETERSRRSRNNLTSTLDNYLNFYKDYYPKIKSVSNIVYEDAEKSDDVHVLETYQIEDVWSEKPKGRFNISFYASGISSALPKPEQKLRTQPFVLTQKEIEETIEVKLDDINWNLKPETKQVKNDYFDLSFHSTYDAASHRLVLNFHYKTLVKTIPADEIEKYIEERSKVMDVTEYAIYQDKNVSNKKAESDDESYFILWGFVVIWLALFIFLSWLFDAERKALSDRNSFYVVSLHKFLLMSFLTAGLYTLYWFYKNWKQIKLAEGSNILPFWRTFFYPFYIYPLIRRLFFYSGEPVDFKRRWLAAGITGFILLASFLQFVSKYWLVFFAIELVLWSWLVYKINKLHDLNSEVYVAHSKIKLRHYAMMLTGLPWILWGAAMTTGLMPSQEIVEGKSLWQRDLKFLHRNQIVSGKETIVYFYSQDVWSNKTAGGGFTSNSVFSYWHDENNQLQIRNIKFSQIKSIDENEDGGFFEEKTIVITDVDDSEFTLYIPGSGSASKKFVDKLRELWQAAPTEGDSK